RQVVLARAVTSARVDGLGGSLRSGGLLQELDAAIREAEGALLEPHEVGGRLAPLYTAYRGELERLGVWDRELERRFAAELVASDLAAWDGRPVFAYGFEDLTGAQWTLVEALAARSDVLVSLPYEPGRAAFASLARTADDLARLADGCVEELPAQPWYDSPALAHLERTLFRHGGDPDPERVPPLHGAIRFLEGAGTRSALELVGEEVLALLREGTAAERIALLCPNVERFRSALTTTLASLGVPYAIEGTLPLARTPFGRALLGLLRFAWLGAPRRHLFAFLRSPFSGLPRPRVDFVEGRLRGRGIREPERVEAESAALLGRPLPHLAALRGERPVTAVRDVAVAMLRAAYGLDRPPRSDEAAFDLRGHDAVRSVADELEGWLSRGELLSREELVHALETIPVRLGRPGEPGRVAVLDLLRARTRRFDAVFVLGLEEGSFPRRGEETPFLTDDHRRELEARTPRRRVVRPDHLARERYLFYSACTRPWKRLTLVRETANDDGRPQEPSPFWDEVRGRFDPRDVARWTSKRPLSEVAWPLERAPSERERLRASAVLAAADAEEARAVASANGWGRRIERALAALERPTRLTHPAVLAHLRESSRFAVTELETFTTCSSMWLFDRVVDPREIDGELDARLRGAIVHQALYRFYTGLPKRLGVERVEGDRLDEALVFLHECLGEAIAGQVRLDLTDVDRLELEGTLARDLEYFLRQEVELGFPLVPRRFEVVFGTPAAPVELQRGLDLGGFTASGKIDRIDVDPMSARGIVQDYKSGAGAHSAAQIESEGKLQIPLYVLALRDLVGIEPLGGLYRALSGSRQARGLVRAEAVEDAVSGLKQSDYLDEEGFWGRVEGARERAREAVERIRNGDVRHDPRGGSCPSWCSRWSMCRIPRA
ncbi:MAG: PD-(D/E)XK nuclease family protein, partial [Thermoleophilia bacterium]|nr:PD-(D/E)XK nuclease family protein [Thermoleophilia bacterium]